jgi:hypothetical protein
MTAEADSTLNELMGNTFVATLTLTGNALITIGVSGLACVSW